MKLIRETKKEGYIKYGLFLCSCGIKFETRLDAVKSGNTKSCGCLNKKRLTKHGMSRTVEYDTWISIRDRCYNPNNSRYHNYGGRGISVCDEWRDSFDRFLEDMGRKQHKGLSIDRIDVNGNYCKDNCKWSTSEEQANNRTNNRYITYKGVTKTMTQWQRELGLGNNTIYDRLRKNWPIEKVLSKHNYHYPQIEIPL